jgi:SAM-dependent methyltransferase
MSDTLHALAAYDAFAPFYDDFTAHHDYDAWTATLEGLARDAGLDGRRLLDVACGTGKSFLPFLARGYAVTACDLSAEMVARAAAKAGGRATLHVADMRTLPRYGAFDLVTVLDDAVNYLLEPEELVAALRGVAANLAPGGVAVFDANTLLAYRALFASATVVQSEGRVQVWRGRASEDFAEGELAEAEHLALELRDDGWWDVTESVHRQRHRPRAAIERAVAAAGLELAAVHGMHLDGSAEPGFDELANSKAVYIARLARGA